MNAEAEETSVEGQSFAEKLDRARKAIYRHAQAAICLLSKEAVERGAATIEQRLVRIAADLEADHFRILVSGRFNAGKSTLLNALFGAPEGPIENCGETGVLPVGRFPTTAVLTDIRYAAEPFVRVWYKDGRFADWSLSRFLDEGKVKRTKSETDEFFDAIRQFEVGIPITLLKAGVVMSDSPGMNDVPEREEITRDALLSSDAAIVVFRSDSGGGMDERQFAAEVADSGCRVFTVINLFDDQRSDDEEVRSYWWNRLVHERSGSAPSLEEFVTRGIFFVDARRAAQGRLQASTQMIEESGILELERSLGTFLISGRFGAHINKSLRETERQADALYKTLRAMQGGLEMSSEALKQAIESLEPQIALLDTQRAALDLILKRHEQNVVTAGKGAFSRFVKGLDTLLPQKLAAPERKLKTLKGFGAMNAAFSKQKQEAIARELVGHLKDIVMAEIQTWTKVEPPAEGLKKVLEPAFVAMSKDIEEQIRKIDQTMQKIDRRALRADDGQGAPSFRGVADMIATHLKVESFGRNMVGVALGGTLAAALVGTIGVKLAFIIGYGLFAAIGVALNPLIILGALVAAIMGLGAIGSNIGIEKSIKQKASEVIVQHLLLSAETSTAIEESLRKTYREITQPISDIVASAIDAEAEELRALKRVKDEQHIDKSRALSGLRESYAIVNDARDEIREAHVVLDQLS